MVSRLARRQGEHILERSTSRGARIRAKGRSVPNSDKGRWGTRLANRGCGRIARRFGDSRGAARMALAGRRP